VSVTNATDPALERDRLRVVIATIVINVVVVSLLTLAPWSDWRTGAALNIIDNCLLVGFAVIRCDGLLARFLLFGLVVGFTELPADAWLVDYTRTLDYSVGGGPIIWRSPAWMPLAWEVVAVQFGYIGLRLWERFGNLGLLMIGLLGAITIPFYEEMARRDTLVAIQRLSHDFIHAVVHHPRRIRHRAGVRIARPNLAARLVAHGDCRWVDWRNLDFRLLRDCILADGSLD
jgi:hypothetical protein